MSSKLKQIKVNFTPEHHAKLSKLAKEKNLTKAQYIRQELRSTFENPREPSIARIHKKADPELLYHLNKIGNNLNQIAKHANEGKGLDLQCLAALLSMEKTLKAFL